jgi:hypothetical protein
VQDSVPLLKQPIELRITGWDWHRVGRDLVRDPTSFLVKLVLDAPKHCLDVLFALLLDHCCSPSIKEDSTDPHNILSRCRRSPWLNPIEPRWLHGKRAIVEPTRTLPADDLKSRVCGYYGCSRTDHLQQYVL